MKVDWPRERSSAAPTRVKILSAMPIRAFLTGMKEPICAMMTSSATCRMKVDLPAMFGPVMIPIWLEEVSRRQSLGTNAESVMRASRTGWRPSLMSRTVSSTTSGRT